MNPLTLALDATKWGFVVLVLLSVVGTIGAYLVSCVKDAAQFMRNPIRVSFQSRASATTKLVINHAMPRLRALLEEARREPGRAEFFYLQIIRGLEKTIAEIKAGEPDRGIRRRMLAELRRLHSAYGARAAEAQVERPRLGRRLRGREA